MKRELIRLSACIALLMLLIVSLGAAEDIVVQEIAIREYYINIPGAQKAFLLCASVKNTDSLMHMVI